MIPGSVKFFSKNKGWGFLVADDDPETDVFVHHTTIVMEGFKVLHNHERVHFEAEAGPRGWAATRVVPILADA